MTTHSYLDRSFWIISIVSTALFSATFALLFAFYSASAALSIIIYLSSDTLSIITFLSSAAFFSASAAFFSDNSIKSRSFFLCSLAYFDFSFKPSIDIKAFLRFCSSSETFAMGPVISLWFLLSFLVNSYCCFSKALLISVIFPYQSEFSSVSLLLGVAKNMNSSISDFSKKSKSERTYTFSFVIASC